MEPVVVGARWDAQVNLHEAHSDRDGAGLAAERVLEQIAEALFVEGPLKGRLCVDLAIDVVKRGSRLAAGSQVHVTGIVRSVRVEQGSYGQSQVIRMGIAVRPAPGSREALVTGTLEVQSCGWIEADQGARSWLTTG